MGINTGGTGRRSSLDFVAALSPETLGVFGAPDEALEYADDLLWSYIDFNRYGLNNDGAANIGNIMNMDYQADIFKDTCYRLHVEPLDALSALVFWWNRYYKDELQEYLYSASMNAHDNVNPVLSDEVLQRAAQLELVADNPVMHAYGEAGIRNILLIQRCIADDIDPNIAMGMVR